MIGNHIWTQRYDHDLKDIFALQDEITIKILEAMGLKITVGVISRGISMGTKNLDADLKTLEGYFLNIPYHVIDNENCNTYGRIVHFYPEVSLRPWHKELRPFKNGAFHLALKSNTPVVPMVFKFREPNKLISMIRKNPLITLVIGKPVYPDPMLKGSYKHRVVEFRDLVQRKMYSMLSENQIKNTASLGH